MKRRWVLAACASLVLVGMISLALAQSTPTYSAGEGLTHQMMTTLAQSKVDVTGGASTDQTLTSPIIRLGFTGTGNGLMNASTYGITNTGCGLGVVVNVAGGYGPCEVQNYVPGAAAFAQYFTVDSVGMYVENDGNPPTLTISSGVTYSPTQILFSTPLTAEQIALLKVGMHVQTNNSTTFLSMISAIDPAGTFVNVVGWAVPGNSAAGQNPQGAATVNSAPQTVYFNQVSKIWGMNITAQLQAGGPQQSAGIELGTSNGSGAPYQTVWGYDSVNLNPAYTNPTGPNAGGPTAGSSFISRGHWAYAFHSTEAQLAHFFVDNQNNPAAMDYTRNGGIGLLSDDNSCAVVPSLCDNISHDFLDLNPPVSGTGALFRVTNSGKVIPSAIVMPAGVNGAQGASIQYNSNSAGGTAQQGYSYLDAAANLVLQAPGGLVKPTAFGIPAATPGSSSTPCFLNQTEYDANYIYVCVSTTAPYWRRAALASW